MNITIGANYLSLFNYQVLAKYPVMYSESMNTVLRQELIRYNRLIQVIRSTLHDLGRAIQVFLELPCIMHFMPVYKLVYFVLQPYGWIQNLKYQILKTINRIKC